MGVEGQGSQFVIVLHILEIFNKKMLPALRKLPRESMDMKFFFRVILQFQEVWPVQVRLQNLRCFPRRNYKSLKCMSSGTLSKS